MTAAELLFLASLLAFLFITVAETRLRGPSVLGVTFVSIAGMAGSFIWMVLS